MIYRARNIQQAIEKYVKENTLKKFAAKDEVLANADQDLNEHYHKICLELEQFNTDQTMMALQPTVAPNRVEKFFANEIKIFEEVNASHKKDQEIWVVDIRKKLYAFITTVFSPKVQDKNNKTNFRLNINLARGTLKTFYEKINLFLELMDYLALLTA
jgi:hypothetical protein